MAAQKDTKAFSVSVADLSDKAVLQKMDIMAKASILMMDTTAPNIRDMPGKNIWVKPIIIRSKRAFDEGADKAYPLK